MKYIRTKEGIFENKPLEKHLGKRKGKGFEIVFKEQDIVKQADTIEELCDCIVEMHTDILSKSPSYSYWIVGDAMFEEWEKYYKQKALKKGYKIFGAIWTDKGLIYVAKMNEKGELELL